MSARGGSRPPPNLGPMRATKGSNLTILPGVACWRALRYRRSPDERRRCSLADDTPSPTHRYGSRLRRASRFRPVRCVAAAASLDARPVDRRRFHRDLECAARGPAADIGRSARTQRARIHDPCLVADHCCASFRGLSAASGGKRTVMHRTQALDYVVMIEGELVHAARRQRGHADAG